MDVKGTSLFSVLNQSLAHAQKKIEVVSDNVARASLPNEKAKVLKENSFQHLVGHNAAGSPLKTNAHHLSGRGAQDFKVVTERSKHEANFSGNSINAQEEMRQMNEAYTKSYEMQTQYASFVKRLKMILGPAR